MATWAIPVTNVPKNGPLTVNVAGAAEEIGSPGMDSRSLESCAVSGSLIRVDEDYLFQGRVNGVFKRECDRCLEPAERRVSVDVHWLFEPGASAHEESAVESGAEIEFDPGEDDERPYAVQDDVIDLAAPAWEELMLAEPAKLYCREDCRGLCSRCGANLNDGPCECKEEQDQKESGFAALKDMYPDLPSNAAEE